MSHPFIDTTEIERLIIIGIVVGNAIQSWRNGKKASNITDLHTNLLKQLNGSVSQQNVAAPTVHPPEQKI